MLVADRGWVMDDRPAGLFERQRLPDATARMFHAPVPMRTGEFDEIDGRVGWYLGLSWQMPDVGKITVVNYNNQGDDAAKTSRDGDWATRFWSVGARTQAGSVRRHCPGSHRRHRNRACPRNGLLHRLSGSFLAG